MKLDIPYSEEEMLEATKGMNEKMEAYEAVHGGAAILEATKDILRKADETKGPFDEIVKVIVSGLEETFSMTHKEAWSAVALGVIRSEVN